MAIDTTEYTINYAGDGVNTTFTAPFPVLDASHLVVASTDPEGNVHALAAGIDYTATVSTDIQGNAGPATVTLAVPFAENWTLTIARIVPLVQDTRLSNQGGAQPKVVEKALDYLTMGLQQIDVTPAINTANTALDAAEQLAIALGAEADIRKKSDNDLRSHIDTGLAEETTARSGSDSALQQAIAKETTTRQSTDVALQQGITDLGKSKADAKHAANHASGGSDPVAPGAIGAMQGAPDDGKRYVASGDQWIAVVVTGEEGVIEIGTRDHRELNHRDAADSHPATAISLDNKATDLQAAMDTVRTNLAAKADAVETAAALAEKAEASALDDYATTKAMAEAMVEKEDKAALKPMAYIEDAPSDDKTYGRNNGAWEEAKGGGDPFPGLIGQVIQYFGPLPDPAILQPYYLVADGSAVSRTDYPELFAAYGTLYGEGDSSITFNLPDLRGMFLRGLDNGRGVDPDRVLGGYQDWAIAPITGSTDFANAPAAQGLLHNTAIPEGVFGIGPVNLPWRPSSAAANDGRLLTFNSQDSPNYGIAHTAEEVRPVNMPCNYLIMATSPAMASSDDFRAALSAVNAGLASKANKSDLVAQILVVSDRKPSGTTGGTFIAGAWRTRDLNTVECNTISGASLNSNQVVLPPGKYKVNAAIPAYLVRHHIARLASIDGETLVLGINSMSWDGAYAITYSFICGVFTLAAQATLEMQHMSIHTFSSEGFGTAKSMTGLDEKYTEAMFEKIQ